MIPHSSPQTDLQANIKALDCVVKHMEVFESRQSLTTPKSPREQKRSFLPISPKEQRKMVS